MRGLAICVALLSGCGGASEADTQSAMSSEGGSTWVSTTATEANPKTATSAGGSEPRQLSSASYGGSNQSSSAPAGGSQSTSTATGTGGSAVLVTLATAKPSGGATWGTTWKIPISTGAGGTTGATTTSRPPPQGCALIMPADPVTGERKNLGLCGPASGGTRVCDESGECVKIDPRLGIHDCDYDGIPETVAGAAACTSCVSPCRLGRCEFQQTPDATGNLLECIKD